MELAKIKVTDDIGNIKVEQENGYVIITCEPNTKGDKDNDEIKIWKDLTKFEEDIPNGSCFIDKDSKLIIEEDNGDFFLLTNKNWFIDERHAKSALAMAQISQLMPYYGGAITDEEWDDEDVFKFVIYRSNNNIITSDSFKNQYEFLSFHTAEQRRSFCSNNKQLVKDYLMID